MSTMHTPAPWEQRDFEGECEIVNHACEEVVCRVTDLASLCARDEANARLIAAAPALLEACQEALALTINWSTTAEPSELEHLSEYRAIIKMLRSSIAQATGGQP